MCYYYCTSLFSSNRRYTYSKILSEKSCAKMLDNSEVLNKLLNNKCVTPMIIIFYNERLNVYRRRLAFFDFVSTSPSYRRALIKHTVDIAMFLLLFVFLDLTGWLTHHSINPF
jgi:hypothetical protein